MTILICLTVVMVVGWYAAVTSRNYDWAEIVGGTVAGLAGVLLVIAVVFVPVNRMGVQSKIRQFDAVRTTIDVARARGESIENAAFQLKVSEVNQWLAGVQYWNTTTFDLWIPDAVDAMEPIQ
jgi:hypothetical protein